MVCDLRGGAGALGDVLGIHVPDVPVEVRHVEC